MSNVREILERALAEWKRGVTSEACLVEGIERALAALREEEARREELRAALAKEVGA
jgi:hypothetical protein